MPYPLFHPDRRGDLPALLSPEEFDRELGDEGDFVEHKRGVAQRGIQETAVAFSNASGGVIVIGVEPNGTLVGVSQPGERAREVHQALRDTANPGRYDVHELLVGDHTLLIVSIARRHDGFAQTSGGALLIRRGASNTALVGADLSRFLQQRTFERFEMTPTLAPWEQAEPSLLARLAEAFSLDVDGDRVDRWLEAGYVVRHGGQLMLTVAGALLLLPDPAAVCGRAYIDIRRYGIDDPDPDKTWQVRGPVDHQVRAATETVVDELGSVSAIVGTDRIEMPKVPVRVIREAVANAVAHRTYEHAGAAVRIELRPSQVSIVSPGNLPEPVTLENIRHQQSARNDRLLSALRRLGLAEDLGMGIDRMEDDMAAELLARPEFDDDGSFFSVTLQLGGAVTARERAWIRTLIQDGRLDDRSALVVVAVAREGAITNGDVRTLLAVDSVEARSMLQSLVTQGILVRQGERGGAEYLLARDIGVPARIRHTDAELDEIALTMAAELPLTNAGFRERTGLDRQEALRVLRRLVERGELIQRGERRGTRYERS